MYNKQFQIFHSAYQTGSQNDENKTLRFEIEEHRIQGITTVEEESGRPWRAALREQQRGEKWTRVERNLLPRPRLPLPLKSNAHIITTFVFFSFVVCTL